MKPGNLRDSRTIIFVILAVLALSLFAGLTFFGDAQEKGQKREPITIRDFGPINQAFIQAVQLAKPAVVNISTATVIREQGEPFSPLFRDPFFRRFFGEEFFRQFEIPRERRVQSLGSGVIVDPSGYIITNNHVVEGATEIKVILDDKREFRAKIIGRDPKSDVAVIKISGKDLPTIRWGNSDQLQVGEWVLAIGNPFGLNQTVTTGIISAKGRANVGIADYEDFIQTDAPINPGNSGGALVNLRGELIGINTAIFSQSGGYMGIGFAIPSNMAKAVMESLIKTGRVIRGYIGLEIQNLTPELAKQMGFSKTDGALVSNVVSGGPADKAGIQRGDIILEYNGKPVTDGAHLKNLVAQTKVGQKVRVKVFRRGREETLIVTIEERVEKVAAARKALAGLEVAELDVNMRRRLGIPSHITGVVVSGVAPGSSADQAGLEVGDIIRR